jgi:hypothetical protein
VSFKSAVVGWMGCCPQLMHGMTPCTQGSVPLLSEHQVDVGGCARQAGVLGLTKTVAREFSSRNILCNAVAPGFVASDMTAAIDPKYEAAILKNIPLGAAPQRLPRPAHVSTKLQRDRYSSPGQEGLCLSQAALLLRASCPVYPTQTLTLSKQKRLRPGRAVRPARGGGGRRQVPGAGPHRRLHHRPGHQRGRRHGHVRRVHKCGRARAGWPLARTC